MKPFEFLPVNRSAGLRPGPCQSSVSWNRPGRRPALRRWLCALGVAALAVHAAPAATYAPPAGGWTYFYSGDGDAGASDAALDGTWSHTNGSDEWDGSRRGPGVGQPGGIESSGGILTLEDAVNLGSGTSNNRKFYLTRDFSRDGVLDNAILNNGITLSFRARLTPVDAKSELTPMPNGYGIYSDAKGMFGARQSGASGGLISFSLTGTANDGAADTPPYSVGQAGLVMNRRNGDAPSGTVDVADAGTLNLLPLDPTAWHEFWITIQANDATPGNGTHLVRIYTNGSLTPVDFNVTAGIGADISGTNYLALGLNNSPSLGAFDVDFFAYKPGVLAPAGGGGFNDNFADRIVLSGANVTTGGANLNATAETGEPEHSALPSAVEGSRRTLWWSWTAANSNAVVITLTRTNGTFPQPMLAVWTGNSVAALSSVASNFSGTAQCRLVFTPAAGTTYHIAVESGGGEFDNGIQFQLNLQVVPPPANDAFANRFGIPASQLDTPASFVGASRQAGESAHGPSNFLHSLWWTWTAPPGTLTNRVTLHADAVSYPPDVGVYTGNSFPLTPISGASNHVIGMTRLVSFLAVPGTTYQFAMAGQQSDPAPNGASSLFGDFRLRFNASTLALVITNRTAVTNGNDTTLITSGLRIQNLGDATSGPVRVRLEANPGYSVRADLSAPAFPAPTNLFTSASVTVPRAQSVPLQVSGLCPAPSGDFDRGIGWGVFAVLEEQVGGAWFAVDYQLAGIGAWPDMGFAGPGGGVIRIDPRVGQGVACIPVLQQVQINAPASLLEGSSLNLSATAFFNCPSNLTFTSTVWSNSHPGSTVTTNGLLRTGSVTNDIPVTVSCLFEYRGVVSNATRQLFIIDLPSPRVTNRMRLANGTFQLGGSGVTNRPHAIQASTNLCCPSNWVTLLPTNVIAINGVWTFLDTNGPAHPRRFYRVRELE